MFCCLYQLCYFTVNVFCRQEAILSAISEKDTHIALLEASKTKNARDDIEKLTCDKQRLNLKLKDLVRNNEILRLSTVKVSVGVFMYFFCYILQNIFDSVVVNI